MNDSTCVNSGPAPFLCAKLSRLTEVLPHESLISGQHRIFLVAFTVYLSVVSTLSLRTIRDVLTAFCPLRCVTHTFVMPYSCHPDTIALLSEHLPRRAFRKKTNRSLTCDVCRITLVITAIGQHVRPANRRSSGQDRATTVLSRYLYAHNFPHSLTAGQIHLLSAAASRAYNVGKLGLRPATRHRSL